MDKLPSSWFFCVFKLVSEFLLKTQQTIPIKEKQKRKMHVAMTIIHSLVRPKMFSSTGTEKKWLIYWHFFITSRIHIYFHTITRQIHLRNAQHCRILNLDECKIPLRNSGNPCKNALPKRTRKIILPFIRETNKV